MRGRRSAEVGPSYRPFGDVELMADVAPSVGFLAEVATAARFRGRGLAERLCRWVSGELVAARGRAALMVDDGNLAAIRVYERIGYRRRAVMASRAV